MTARIRRSHGNIFKDLGFSPEVAENLKIRSLLMTRLSELIKKRKLVQAEAARLFGVSQPRVSDLVRGKIDRFSIDTLVAMLGRAGVHVRLVARDRRHAAWREPLHGLSVINSVFVQITSVAHIFPGTLNSEGTDDAVE